MDSQCALIISRLNQNKFVFFRLLRAGSDRMEEICIIKFVYSNLIEWHCYSPVMSVFSLIQFKRTKTIKKNACENDVIFVITHSDWNNSISKQIKLLQIAMKTIENKYNQFIQEMLNMLLLYTVHFLQWEYIHLNHLIN